MGSDAQTFAGTSYSPGTGSGALPWLCPLGDSPWVTAMGTKLSLCSDLRRASPRPTPHSAVHWRWVLSQFIIPALNVRVHWRKGLTSSPFCKTSTWQQPAAWPQLRSTYLQSNPCKSNSLTRLLQPGIPPNKHCWHLRWLSVAFLNVNIRGTWCFFAWQLIWIWHSTTKLWIFLETGKTCTNSSSPRNFQKAEALGVSKSSSTR